MSAYPFYRLIKSVVTKLGELLKGPSHQNWPDERWLRTIETHVSVSSFLQLGVVQTICTHFFYYQLLVYLCAFDFSATSFLLLYFSQLLHANISKELKRNF